MVKKLLALIRNQKELYFDTSIFIYYFQNDKKYSPVIDTIFSYLEKKKIKICISTLLLTELLVEPYKKQKLEIAEKWLDYLKTSNLVSILDVTPQIAINAAFLRAKYNIKTPDSIHLGTALNSQSFSSIFITNDKELKRVKEIKVFYLNDLIKFFIFHFFLRLKS